MSKNKVKLLLVEDYIELSKISISCERARGNIKLEKEDRRIYEELMSLNKRLLEVYEKVFFRFGLMDVSYLLLKDGLKTKEIKGKTLTKNDLKNILFKLRLMVKTLALKLKKLSLNEIEMNYIVQNLSM